MRCVQCWCDLSTSRSIGMAAGGIWWPAVVKWCEVHGFDRDNTQIVVHVIRTLDNDRAEAEQIRAQQEEQTRARRAGRR